MVVVAHRDVETDVTAKLNGQVMDHVLLVVMIRADLVFMEKIAVVDYAIIIFVSKI
jgi:hypothetical protein